MWARWATIFLYRLPLVAFADEVSAGGIVLADHHRQKGIELEAVVIVEILIAQAKGEHPLPDAVGARGLSVDQIVSRLNRHPRGRVPQAATRLTAFIDVHQNLLYYVVCGWEEQFTGAVIDYGAWPDPQRPYFTLRDATRTLGTMTPGAGLEGAIYAGLERLTGQLLDRPWEKDAGGPLFIERCLIDANWGHSTEVIYRFCRQSAHPALVTPSHGRFVGAGSRPFSDYERKAGDRVGWNWRIPAATSDRPVRHVVFDSNFWKSFVQARLAAAPGDQGSLTLFGDEPETHRLFADHLTAEYCVQTTGRGRTVDEWKMRPEQNDNHWFDGLVGCAVAASIQGASLLGEQQLGGVRRKFRVPDHLRPRPKLW